jgi:hypothetical protein
MNLLLKIASLFGDFVELGLFDPLRNNGWQEAERENRRIND